MSSVAAAAPLLLVLALSSCCFLDVARSDLDSDKAALLALRSAVGGRPLLWNLTDPPCNWTGVFCDSARQKVIELRFPAMGLAGGIPAGTIANLTQLQTISFHSNSLSGPLPDLASLSELRNLYLQSNSFSGGLPPSLFALPNLVRLNLASNKLSGEIPPAFGNLTRLKTLFLEDNQFTGPIPDLNLTLDQFNVSSNQLTGPIPSALSTKPPSAFAGNSLCGPPLQSCNATGNGNKLSGGAIAGIVIGSVIGLFLILLVLIILCRRKSRGGGEKPKSLESQAARGAEAEIAQTREAKSVGEPKASSAAVISGDKSVNKSLVFFGKGDAVAAFDLEDLLRASAEVLGKGSVGTSYKAVLEEGTTVVVKRLKDVAASKKEFEGTMEVLGKVKHENVVPLRAFYYSKDEKLLVYDYMAAGSLSALLHGSRGSGRTPLDWENRLKIAIATGRGLAHLHAAGKVVHGNIKSSNVLLRPDHNACVSDFGLNPLFGTATPPNRVAGYRAPEVVETRRVTFQSDVYSFGVLLLELLTGKAPNQASLGEEGIDLPRWVQSVVREEWTAEVFDVELMRYQNIEEEMVQLLQIAMSCVAVAPDQRPPMVEVVRMMEEMNRGETDDGLRQSSDDPSKGSDGQTPPTESRTPPIGITP